MRVRYDRLETEFASLCAHIVQETGSAVSPCRRAVPGMTRAIAEHECQLAQAVDQTVGAGATNE